MNSIKTLLINRYKTFALLSLSMAFSIVLLMIRIKLAHSFFFSFLVWNLFLALIPYVISTYLTGSTNLNKIEIVVWFLIWLLFLPNAPYIVTDLLHLKVSSHHRLWLDVLVVSAFALNGLLIFFISLTDMEDIINRYMNKKQTNYFIMCLLFLCSFGVYLGRFLRYNSWELIQNPTELLNDVFEITCNPNAHLEAWVFTLIFGVFLNLGYWVFKQLFEKPNSFV
ncbi:DUF1361 domain-containing protein [Mariniflexile soesokkakense]|uniref:DUF1361 domain-containing protein n=1 Tax=Mariniflexile soesokkakense TaxID=1343160 RepID=A0ABV0A6Q6_9FLAO